ncbi:hypothetical protein HYH03_006666 [Edaphochlamys debaryana]|uniref:Uncharacterized protein n=1 Tax=Edaphochlamys debaryana TaxID=47281 RepID=A0A836BZU7_9CHLO|nr:hypothetical protein HYH03_006666 [Edaphochlamys debaryana]|eukprot:KAG2495055.1 hypothetical protein HYH03_006666 [Edaphochlamys debaryana]
MLLQSPLLLPAWDFLAGVSRALECTINVDVAGVVVHRSPAVIQNYRVMAGADGLLQRFQGWEVLSWRARPSAGAIDLSLCPPPEPQPRSRQQDAAPREDARSAHSFLSGGRYPAESSAHRSQPAQPGASSRSAAPETQDLLLSLLGTLPAQRLSPAAAQLLLQSLERRQREEEQEGPPAQLLPPQPKQELHPTAVSYRTGGPPQETEAAAGTAWAGASQQPTALAARVSAYSQPEGSWRRAQEPGGRDVRTRCATDGLEAPGPTPGGLSSLQPPSAHAEQVSASVAALISQLQSSRPAGPPAGGKEQAQQRAPASRVQSYEVPAASDEEPAAPALPSAVPRDGRVPHFSGGAVSLGRPALEVAEHAPAAPVRAASCPEDRTAKPEALGPQAAAAALVGSSISPEDTQDPAVLWEMLRALQRQQDKIQAQLAAAQQSKAGTRDRQGGRSGAGVGPAVQPAAAVQSSAPPSPSAHASIKEEAGAPRGPLELQARLSSEHQDDATDEVVARTPTRPMNRYLTSVEVRVLFSEEQAAALSAPPCGLALTMQVFLDGAPLGPPQGAQVCRYNTSSPRYLTSIPSQEATSPPLPWKRLADTFLHYRRMRSGVLQMHASTRLPGQGDDTTLQLAPAVAAALPPLTLFTPPGLRRLAAAGLAAAAASGQEGGSEFGVCEDGPAEEAWAEETAAPRRHLLSSPVAAATAELVPPPLPPLVGALGPAAAVGGGGGDSTGTADAASSGPAAGEVQVCCPPRSLSRYLTKSELEVLVGPEVYGCMCDGSKLSGVKVQFEVNGKKMPEVYVADIERYNPSSPFYLKASSGRGVDGLPWRSIPPNATVQWKRMADNTLVLAQVSGPGDSTDCGDGSPRERAAGGRKRRAPRHSPSDDSGTVTETETEDDPSEYGGSSNGATTDEEAGAKPDARKRARDNGTPSSPKPPRSPPTSTHLLDALAGAAAAAALDRDAEADPKAEARAEAVAPSQPAAHSPRPTEAAVAMATALAPASVGVLVPAVGVPAPPQRRASPDVVPATNLAAAGQTPVLGPSSFSGPSSSGFTSRIVATNLYIGRRQLQALYGPDFAAEIKSEMQLHLNGSLQPEVFTVQWKEGCHKGSFYPRGAPLGQLRGRFLQDIRWLDEQANRLAFVAWDTPPADWAGQRRTRGAGANAPVTKTRKWLWQRQAELAARRGASAAPSGAGVPGPTTSVRTAADAEGRAPAATAAAPAALPASVAQNAPQAQGVLARGGPAVGSAQPLPPSPAPLAAQPRPQIKLESRSSPSSAPPSPPQPKPPPTQQPQPSQALHRDASPFSSREHSRLVASKIAPAPNCGALDAKGSQQSAWATTGSDPPAPLTGHAADASSAEDSCPERAALDAPMQLSAPSSAGQPPSPRQLQPPSRAAAGASGALQQGSRARDTDDAPPGSASAASALEGPLRQLERLLQERPLPQGLPLEQALPALIEQLRRDARAAEARGGPQHEMHGPVACRSMATNGGGEGPYGGRASNGAPALDGSWGPGPSGLGAGGAAAMRPPQTWAQMPSAAPAPAPAPTQHVPAAAFTAAPCGTLRGVSVNHALIEQLRAEALAWRVDIASRSAPAQQPAAAFDPSPPPPSRDRLQPFRLDQVVGGKRQWEGSEEERAGGGPAPAQRVRLEAEAWRPVEPCRGRGDAAASREDGAGAITSELLSKLLGALSSKAQPHPASSLPPPRVAQLYGGAADVAPDLEPRVRLVPLAAASASLPPGLEHPGARCGPAQGDCGSPTALHGVPPAARWPLGSAGSAPPAPGAVDTSRVCVGGDFEPTEHLLIRAMPWLSVHLAQRWYPAALGRTSEDPFPVTVAFEIDGWLLPERYSAQLKSYPTNNGLFLPGLPLRRVRGLLRTGWRRLPDGTLVLQARTPQQPVAPDW